MWPKPSLTAVCLGKEMIKFNDIVAASHFFVSRYLQAGDVAIDATAGNGRCTAFLARSVGPEGWVHAFDIQEKALSNTHLHLLKEGLATRVSLHLNSHRRMQQHVSRPVKAIMFNLGYLPGGNKEIVTTPEETIAGLAVSLQLLVCGGIISIATYPGHPGGMDEERAVAAWCNRLCPHRYQVLCLNALNRKKAPPSLWIVKG